MQRRTSRIADTDAACDGSAGKDIAKVHQWIRVPAALVSFHGKICFWSSAGTRNHENCLIATIAIDLEYILVVASVVRVEIDRHNNIGTSSDNCTYVWQTGAGEAITSVTDLVASDVMPHDRSVKILSVTITKNSELLSADVGNDKGSIRSTCLAHASKNNASKVELCRCDL